MRKRYLFGAIFVTFFAGLITLFALGLKHNPDSLDLATKDSKLPEFALPSLLGDKMITNENFITDRPYYLLNFWGTWCPSCYKEHGYLMQLGNRETLYGINWKDDRMAAKQFIANGGNPYNEIIVDDKSFLAIGLGVYGAPETFLIKADGTIVHRYAGALNEVIWQKEFVPKIKILRAEQ